jgi:hypothetical protein
MLKKVQMTNAQVNNAPTASTFTANVTQSQNDSSSKAKSKTSTRVQTAEKQLTLMVIVLSFLSILNQFALVSFFIYTLFNSISVLFSFFQVYISVLKHACNFFIFYFFNNNFRIYFRSVIKRESIIDQTMMIRNSNSNTLSKQQQ